MLRFIFIISILALLISCSKENDIIYKPSEKLDPYLLYEEAYNAFERRDFFFANKKFTEAELNFTISELAAKSSIMASFSLYGISFYNQAEENLKRFLKTYPADKNIIYAHYLLAIIYYEQISDEKKDLKPLLNAKAKIEFFLKEYPNSEYAIDLNFKKDLIENQLAAKELYIAKYYISVKKWIPALNRLKKIVQDYDKTIYVEEALHRLVEINYYLGIKEEANRYAAILGYNYNSSEWYKESYRILNKNYKVEKKDIIEEKEGILKRIINKIRVN